ncbi:MAG: NAD(P)/FAD-dependent oxidoreductase, partial [Chloroflexota bacterium]|nr:NAD(P)/FAD-dependent oxidoreductase [Chloroflexota bacterium]
MTTADVVVIGTGHNGLACACYLARAGCRVLVLEMAERIGGAAHTAATIADKPEYRFDTCSVIHNMINMTTVIEELRLRDVGLEYIETDPFTISYFPGGEVVRFYRSVEQTCDEIARYAPGDAEAYDRFIRAADPVTEFALSAFRSSGDNGKGVGEWWKRFAAAGQTLRRNHPNRLVQQLTGSYGTLLAETF